ILCMAGIADSYIFPHIFQKRLTPLHLAVLRGHRDLARMLLDAGADINAMVSHCADLNHGQSPLMHAVESSNADMVYFLIEVIRVGEERRVLSHKMTVN
uniref:BCL3 transcription coactivator n=1 Tax=Mastacembelus armatus TaxID=205130 RepID=A0A7N8XRP1_9TELE